jgi:hypothetical protein
VRQAVASSLLRQLGIFGDPQDLVRVDLELSVAGGDDRRHTLPIHGRQ